jgi:hypothetical protein
MLKSNFLNFLFSLLAIIIVLQACERGTSVPEPVEGYNPAGSLLLHYDFVNGATDKGEYEYDGKIVGAPEKVDGRMDAALFLNETDGDNGCDQLGGQYVQLPLIGAVWEKGFSIAAWVEFKEIRNYERIFDMGNGLGETSGHNVTFSRLKETNDLAITSWVNADSTYNRINGRLVAKNAIVNGELQHYAATVSPEGTMRIFVNGIKVAERTDGNEVLNISRERNYLGHSSYCYIDPDLKGVVDDFRLYNKPLSEQEVKDLYKN